jgi:hypothetical protein
MEIAPVPGIRALPAVRARLGGATPPAIFDVDASAKPGDGSGQQSGRKAAGAEENDDELRVGDELGAASPEESQPGRIDYFA